MHGMAGMWFLFDNNTHLFIIIFLFEDMEPFSIYSKITLFISNRKLSNNINIVNTIHFIIIQTY